MGLVNEAEAHVLAEFPHSYAQKDLEHMFPSISTAPALENDIDWNPGQRGAGESEKTEWRAIGGSCEKRRPAARPSK